MSIQAISTQDKVVCALTAWRENRGGGRVGMQSVINVVMNRARKRGTSLYSECVRPQQFSSITAKGDPELILWPKQDDPQWLDALTMMEEVEHFGLADVTGGATVYYDPKGISSTRKIAINGMVVPFPLEWNQGLLRFTVEIAGQLFFTEV